MMIEVHEAISRILEHCHRLPPELIPLSSAAIGHVLAESIYSDIDSPPFDKALMDGYAVRSADLLTGMATLEVIEEVTAGQTPSRTLFPGQATRIMTGAPIPVGADAVVQIEHTKALDSRVVIDTRPLQPGQNILPCGQEMRLGDVVLESGTKLRAQDFGILASVGRSAVQQIPAPRIAILATGDELVEPTMKPGPGQIRNSNAPMLQAQTTRAGGLSRYLGIARDRAESLLPLIEEGLNTAEILVLSGGVSAGKLDLVPEMLQQLGVTAHFHSIRMKPGKPLFFGTLQKSQRPRLVFGLPGNPVSSFVCFELFIRPAIKSLAGFTDLDHPTVQATLATEFSYKSDRPTYYPAELRLTPNGWETLPLPWFGSADLRALHRADGLIVLPPGDNHWTIGSNLAVLRLDP